MKNVNPANKSGIWAIVSLLIPIVIIIMFFSVTVVPAGNVGVYDLFGKVSENEYKPGLQLKFPFAKIIKMPVKTQEYTMSGTLGEGAVRRADAISALTEEGLTVNLDITVLFRLKAENANDVYSKIGQNYVDVVVRPQVRSTIREIIAGYKAKVIYSEKRLEIEQMIFDKLSSVLNNRGIIVEKVLIRNVELPSKLASAIEAKLTAEQQIEEREFKVQAEKKEAERKRVEAQGISDANKIISTTLSDKYLTWYWINNLDTHDSVIYVPIGDEGVPLFKEIGKETKTSNNQS